MTFLSLEATFPQFTCEKINVMKSKRSKMIYITFIKVTKKYGETLSYVLNG